MQVKNNNVLAKELEESEGLMLVCNKECDSISSYEDQMITDYSFLKTIREQYKEELLERARALNIPLNQEDWAWSDLSDIVCEYEALLEEAKEYGIDWDLSEYDPIALQQEIEYYQRQGAQERCQSFGYFYATRGC